MFTHSTPAHTSNHSDDKSDDIYPNDCQTDDKDE